jgi:transposase InsO family protein
MLNITKTPQLVVQGTCLGSLQPAHTFNAGVMEINEADKTVTKPSYELKNDEAVIPKLMDRLSDELTGEQRSATRRLLQQYEDIFSKNEFDVGRTPLVEYHIDTGSSRPIRQALRRQPLKHLDAIDENVKAMLQHGIIEPAASPWASNVVIVAKKDGNLRFCIDYRAINNVTYKDAYPLPLIDNCLNAMNGSTWFTTLDLRAGYHNIPVAKEDRDKTAFITRRGCWRYTVMPFGLTCAPSVFQRLMDLVLAGLSYDICLVYLDDIIIYSNDFSEHLRRLEAVFERLRLAKLKLKPSKCNLLQRRVSFLGHVISGEGIAMQNEKVEAVQKWPQPRNLHDVRSFLGICGYYRRFIAGFSEIASPLYALTGKDVTFAWRTEHQQAFKTLKDKLTTAPVLAMPSNDGQYVLDTDASDIGLGAVLSQIQDGEERVIAYASRTISKPERNYETTRKELLAVVFGLKQFRQYLLGKPFTIRTDHSALSWLRRTPEPLPQLARWLTFIEQFNYTILHRAGKKHGNADSLSRKRSNDDDGEEQPQLQQKEAAEMKDVYITNYSITVSNEGEADEQNRQSTPSSAKPHQSQVPTDILHQNTDPLAKDELAAAQVTDDDIGTMLRMFSNGSQQPPIEQLLSSSETTKRYWSQWNRFSLINGLLCRTFIDKNGQTKCHQALIPRSLREEAVRRCHVGMTGGHMGIKKTLDQVQQRFYWTTWKADTARICRQCQECASYHRGKLPRSAPLQPIATGAPFERLSIDLTGPHCRSNNGFIWILTCIDPFTKWVEAFPIRNKEAETVARTLVEQVFTRFGVPIAMLSDCGKEVDGNLMKAVCRLLNIDKMHTTFYKPSTNSAIERLHRTMNSMLGKVVAEHQKDWDTHLPYVMAAYRASRHEATGYSPNHLVLGRENRMPIDIVLDLPSVEEPAETYDDYVDKMQERLREAYKLVREHIGQAAERNKKYYDLRVRPQKYAVGNWVLYYNPRHYRGREDKWSRKFIGPFLVTKVLPPVNLVLQRSAKAKPLVVHLDKVKLFTGVTPQPWVPITTECEPLNESHRNEPTVINENETKVDTSHEPTATIESTPRPLQRPPRESRRPARYRE